MSDVPVDEELRLRDWRLKQGGGHRPASELLVEARRRRDSSRKAVKQAQAQLSTLLAEQQASKKRLDKLSRQKTSRTNDPDLALPSLALRSGGDDAVAEQIRALMQQNGALEEALTQHRGTKLHLQTIENEKKDAARRIRELRQQDKTLREQLAIKRDELTELESLIKPSAVRQRFEEDAERLRKEINSSSSQRTSAEREAATLQKRLLRVRTVLGSWLKNEGLHKPQTPLPPPSDELAARLAEYVVRLGDRVRGLETSVRGKEDSATELEHRTGAVAAELKRLVAKQRTGAKAVRAAVGLLTDGAAAKGATDRRGRRPVGGGSGGGGEAEPEGSTANGEDGGLSGAISRDEPGATATA